MHKQEEKELEKRYWDTSLPHFLFPSSHRCKETQIYLKYAGSSNSQLLFLHNKSHHSIICSHFSSSQDSIQIPGLQSAASSFGLFYLPASMTHQPPTELPCTFVPTKHSARVKPEASECQGIFPVTYRSKA